MAASSRVRPAGVPPFKESRESGRILKRSRKGNRPWRHFAAMLSSIQEKGAEEIAQRSIVAARRPSIDTVFADTGRWTFRSTRDCIASIEQADRYMQCSFTFENRLSAELGFPVPTMTFAANCMQMENGNFTIRFSCLDAFRALPKDTDLKVAASRHWNDSRIQVHQAYDWTYSTYAEGELVHPATAGKTYNWTENSAALIDHALLRQRAPILHYDELVLYEDELADNGQSIYSIRLRVMPWGWFALARHFLRVDRVCMRTREVRLMHRHARPGEIVKEVKVRHADDFLLGNPTGDANNGLLDVDKVVAGLPTVLIKHFCLTFDPN